MDLERLQIPDVVLIAPKKHGDPRGFFSEALGGDALIDLGLGSFAFVQDDYVHTIEKSVLCGLHFQSRSHAHGTLARCTRGSIFRHRYGLQVRRPHLPRLRRRRFKLGATLGSTWLCAIGYVTLEGNCEVVYKVTEYYAPNPIAALRGMKLRPDKHRNNLDWQT
jgi:dTDP-4-dehydrorhamnose 3,5-epimerase